VDDADDLDTVIDDSIEDHVLADGEIAETRPDVVTGRSKLRVLGKRPTALVDAVGQGGGGRGLSAAMYCQISIRSCRRGVRTKRHAPPTPQSS
jgi:hypothetical protein